jgi:hypothetical protein
MQLKMKELELEFAREKKPLFEKWLQWIIICHIAGFY